MILTHELSILPQPDILMEMALTPAPCSPLRLPLQEQCGSYTFIPYVVSPQGKVFACDAAMMTGIKELMQPSFQLEPLLTLLVERLVHLLNNVHIQSRSVVRSDDSQSVAASKTLTSAVVHPEQRVLPGVHQARDPQGAGAFQRPGVE